MSKHFRDVCRHGRVLSQCRCPGPKEERIQECPPNCPGLDIPVTRMVIGPTGNFTETIRPHDLETLVRLGILVLDSTDGTYRKAD